MMGSDATMGTNSTNYGNPDEEVEFAIEMAAKLRTAARAADELGVSYRELARRFADQVDADLASDADPLGTSNRRRVPRGLPAWQGRTLQPHSAE
jgi:hypothetical protein